MIFKSYPGLSKPITEANSRVSYPGLVRKARRCRVVSSVIPPVTVSTLALTQLARLSPGDEALLQAEPQSLGSGPHCPAQPHAGHPGGFSAGMAAAPLSTGGSAYLHYLLTSGCLYLFQLHYHHRLLQGRYEGFSGWVLTSDICTHVFTGINLLGLKRSMCVST